MNNFIYSKNINHAVNILHNEAAKESAEYIKKFLKDVIVVDADWWDIAISKIEIKGLCLEFGVWKGGSINYMSSKTPNLKWYGFDSFLGMQEDWNKGGFCQKGYFSLNGELPKVNENVFLIKGWFKNTLPKFLKKNKEFISFMHIDCDTYESTKEILDIIGPSRLVKNTRILFDEYQSYIGWKYGEYKAWQEFVKKHNLCYKYEMFGERQALVKII